MPLVLCSDPVIRVCLRRWTLWAALAFALAPLPSGLARAADTLPTFGLLGVLNTDAASDSSDDLDVRFATDGESTWLAVWQASGALGSDADVFFARSTNGGATWSAPAPLDAGAAVDTGEDTDPAIASDGAGIWVAVWSSTEPLAGSGIDADIVFARSADDGLTWSSPAPLDTGAAADLGVDDEPQIASDGAGNWIAMWTSEDVTPAPYPDEDIRVARSTDGGVTWFAPDFLTADAASTIVRTTRRASRTTESAPGSPSGSWTTRPGTARPITMSSPRALSMAARPGARRRT